MTTETTNTQSWGSAGMLKVLWNQYRAYRAKRRQQRINRAAFRTMLQLDHHMLKDLGVRRDDVLWASGLPLSQDAGEELRKISLLNRTRF